MDLKNNPFAKVFPSIEAAERYAERVREEGRTVFLNELENHELQGKDFLINLIVEEVFNFTLCKNPPAFKRGSETHLLYLEDVSGIGKLGIDYIESLELVLFERLLLEEPTKHLISSNKSSSPKIHVVETQCLCYLFECYCRLKKQNYPEFKESIKKMISYVVRNASTALKQPEVYEKQNVYQQVLDLFSGGLYNTTELTSFLSEITDDIDKEEGSETVFSAFSLVLSLVQENLNQSNILTYSQYMIHVLHTYATIPKLAAVLLRQGHHRDSNHVGRSFAESALGAAFNISILPKNSYLQYEFFDRPLDSNLKVLEDQLWTSTNGVVCSLHNIVMALLKSNRHETLTWLGNCLDKNAPRGRLSALNAFSLDTLNCVSDGFMLNLSGVLLRLAEPFIADIQNLKWLKIDPTYPAAKVSADGENGVHMGSLGSDTCLVSAEEGQQRPCAKQFSFISECFYMTHRALNLGAAVVQDKAQSLYQEIGMMQARLGPDARNDEMETAMAKYLSLRCALIEPSTLMLEGQFVMTTCTWLVQVVLDPDLREDREAFNLTEVREVTFPLPTTAPPTLRCIPEVLLENVSHYLVATKRFEVAGVIHEDLQQLEPVLTYLLVFMSGSARARNPHLRAQLAECLDCLLPKEKASSAISTFVREQLFKTHPHRSRIVESLLDVFVGIEMTGQSVTFEQKFNYRRPMYTVMEYLWNLEEQKQCFKNLAADAEANMEAVNPPLFLRFLNLLMNDAVFLLDEALSNMASLRTMMAAREAGEWENLPPNERQRNENSFVHIGMTARFDNILGTKTIECLVYLSSEIRTIFCHRTMVDRIAAMLNYFLLHLVGPNKKNFKVKDQLKEYSFDPASIVLNICKIYIHLSDSEEFCSAVSRDGRSYSPQLFGLAENVLVRIGGGMIVSSLQRVAEEVHRLADLQQQEEGLLGEVPEEYLDPIMSTLMTDPVILPSSRQIVDRSTIARHLLSDQSDPFNREPLTMDMVRSATELKEQIEAWVSQRHGDTGS
ncbi:ubiquitin conjugation factor E4 A isoform X3 [Homalodisca vitripennis]|uniref:ubiquitin conjugation factor E4 A isoform X3 n=1 Tax=Homalodisca vitripennis TaxID=197043 RepID=UPI001EEA5E31|nr:ubiquitin conjugation factor E4 A isoform X3 [Homalodisca vitripennis]